ncbi:MAG: hypothetical protein ACRDBY_03110 [Cetobacterium sp.]
MTKKEFLEVCDTAIKEKKGIVVFLDIPCNKHYEHIANSAPDVKNKKDYYDKNYDENMKHINAPVTIVDIIAFDVKINPKKR